MSASPRRIARTVALVFALGAATTVAATLSLALCAPLGSTPVSISSRCAVWEPINREASFSVCAYEGHAYQAYWFDPPWRDQHGTFVAHEWDPPLDAVIPSWAFAYAQEFWDRTVGPLGTSVPYSSDRARLIELGLSVPYSTNRVRLIELHGWPCAAAFSVSDLAFNRTRYSVVATTGWLAPRFSHARPFRSSPFDAVIPKHILWRGTVGNAAVYTAFWSVLLLVPSRLRRYLRRRRGLCPACAYNLSGLPPAAPCPECGKRGLA